MNKPLEKASETSALIEELASDLNLVIVTEHQILQSEQKQISTLIRDAIKTLEDSFNRISKQISEQSQLVKSIVEITTINNGPENMDRLTELTQGITKDTANAVRSLQFEDIIQQLTAHSCNRAGQIESLFSKLGERLDKLYTADSADTDLIMETIKAMQEDLQNFCNVVKNENPVKQRSMKEGKIELF